MGDTFINPILDKLSTAKFGRDVRQAIHDGIKRCYTDATTGVEVREDAPVRDNTYIWVHPGEHETFCIPEIDDYNVTPNDTWSSEKISLELSGLTGFMETGVANGLIGAEYSGAEFTTNMDMANCTKTLPVPSQAYFNGFVADKDVSITGIKFKNGSSASAIGMFVFDADDTLVASHPNVSVTMKGDVAVLPTPIELKTGSYMLVRVITGSGYYFTAVSSIYKEYQPGTGTLMNSTIKLGIEFVYKTKGYTMLSGLSSLSDYPLPKCKETDGEITYIGRWFDKTINGVSKKCANACGSALLFKVSGTTKVDVIFKALSEPQVAPYYIYSVDGGSWYRKQISSTSISLADTGEHIVWIVIDGMGENDPISGGKWYGSVGVYLDSINTNGGTMTALSYTNRQIMFIGDSIVEGINVKGRGANANVNSATDAFAFKTARKVNAIPLLCGYGGTAVLGNSSFHKPIEAIDYNMNGVPVNDQSPDIIVIEHGYNDGSLVSSGSYTEAQFATAYTQLINRVTVKYPGVPIVCLIPFKQSLANSIRSCAKAKSHCYVVETGDWGVTFGEDGTHPNIEGSDIAASKLSKALVDIFSKAYFYC